MDVLSRFLDKHRASAHSTTLIADRNNGKIIAFPNKQKGVRVENGKLKIATLAEIDDSDVREATRQHARADTDRFRFSVSDQWGGFIAAFANFPDGLGQPWQVITLTPIDDFVGTLKATNRLIMVVIIILTAIELFFIFFASRRLSQPVENVSRQLQAIESLQFDVPTSRPSNIREIARLESRGFTASQLAEIVLVVRADGCRPPAHQVGHSADPGRRAAIPHHLLFRPGEFFQHTPKPSRRTTCWCRSRPISSRFPPRYRKRAEPSTSSSATASWRSGMLRFSVHDHVLRACAGALRAARRMERVNDIWEAEGRPRIGIRIGLNCADVLVGNVGSSARLSYTALGDGVNVAARLEGINKQFGTTICISDSIYERMEAKILARPLKRVQVKGRKTRIHDL